MDADTSTYLRDLAVSSQGYIVGYDKVFQGYIGRLLKLGLTPDTTFTVIRHHFPQPNSHLIEVNGRLIQLTPPEANALCVESIESSEVE
ncbi:MAG: FeoA family protein [Microcystaceae cyanobacterium]